MYLHLGQSTVIRDRDIIGIFDLDITSQSYRTRQYLSKAEQAGQVESARKRGRGSKRSISPSPPAGRWCGGWRDKKKLEINVRRGAACHTPSDGRMDD